MKLNIRTKSLIYLIIHKIISNFFRIFPIDNKKILFIPKNTSLQKNIKSSLTSDNCLCILKALSKESKFKNYKFILFYDLGIDNSLFINSQNIPKTIFLQSYKNKSFAKLRFFLEKIFYESTSKFIISNSPLISLKNKRRNQINIASNYYNPFKKDSYFINKTNIDYAFSCSLNSAYIDSQVSKIPINKYIITGFPRNDYLKKPIYSREEILNFLGIKRNISKIIIYTPTHRNEYSSSNFKYLKNFLKNKNNYNNLNKLLKDNSSILLISDHAAYFNKSKLKISDKSNYIYDISENQECSLYDILPNTDFLISDYSSIYFDYLLLDKPVIFDFSDFSLYRDKRAFSYDPINNICAGPITYNFEEFIDVLKSFLDASYIYFDKDKEKRLWVNRLVNKYNDANSTERVIRSLAKIMKMN